MAGSTYGTLFSITTWGNPTVRLWELLLTAVPQDFLFPKLTYRNIWTGENPDRVNIQQNAQKVIEQSFYPGYLKEERLALLFPL